MPAANIVVTTADGDPEKFKISDKLGFDVATIEFDVVSGDGSPIRGWRIRVNGVDYDTGMPAGGTGLFPSKDLTVDDNVSVVDFSVPSGTHVVEDVTFAEAAPITSGDVTVNIHVYTEGEGWT